MDIKAFPALIVGVVVALVLAGATLPIWADTLASEDTFTNEGYYRMSKLDADSNYKLFWDHTNPYQVTVNDTDIFDLKTGIGDYQAVTVIGTNEFTLRFFKVTDNPRIQLYGGTGWGFGGASVSSETDMTVIISGGEINITTTAETPLEITNTMPENTYAIDKNGPFTMKKSNVDAYVLDNSSVIVLCGFTEGGGASAGVYADGTIETGLDFTLFRPSGDSATAVFSDETITSQSVNGYNGLSLLKKVNFSVTVTAGTLTPEYTYFIVPYEVTAERTVYMGGPLGVLVGVLPLLIVAGLVTGAVVWFINRKG